MANRLHDIRPTEVSLVHRGANRRRFLLAKADGGELDADVADILAAPVAKEAELLDLVRSTGGDEGVEKAASTFARARAALHAAYADAPDEVRKAMKQATGDEPDDDADEWGAADVAKAYEAVVKDDFTDEERSKMAASGEALSDGSYPIPTNDYLQRAIRAVGRGKNNSHAAIRNHIVKRARALGATDQLPDEWGVQKEDRMSETAQAVPVKKEDGSWDLSAVPEDQRSAFETFLKSHDDEVAELRKQAEAEQSKADEAIKIAKAEQEHRETREYVAKSAELENLAKDDSEFGGLLYAIAKAEHDKHLPEGTVEKLETVLKAANEQVGTAGVFAEAGRTGHGAPAEGSAQAKADAAAAELRKADPSLTKEQAFAKALENDKTLYTDIRKEQS